nr:unnamed protein product [Callosobruchus chinensis]
MHSRNFLFSPKAVVLHTSRTERYDRAFIPAGVQGLEWTAW